MLFRSFRKAERTAARSALSDEEKRKMLGWVTGIRASSGKRIRISAEKSGDVRIEKSVIFGENGEKLPFVQLIPGAWDGKRVCMILGEDGKAVLERPDTAEMLAGGVMVVSGDVFLTGEFAGAVQNIAGSDYDNRYFTTFNYTTDALRTQDAALLIRTAESLGGELTVRAEGCAARWAACALALCGGVTSAKLDRAALENVDYFREFFLPGICAAGGLEECLALAKCPVEGL